MYKLLIPVYITLVLGIGSVEAGSSTPLSTAISSGSPNTTNFPVAESDLIGPIESGQGAISSDIPWANFSL